MPVRLPSDQMHLHATDVTWRNRAVSLAFEKQIDKQARMIDTQVHDGKKYAVFSCLSSQSPTEYFCQIRPDDQYVGCTCEAGRRMNPCSHVGASLLVLYGLSQERRDVPPLAL